VDPWFARYCGDLADARGLETYLRAKAQLIAMAGGVRGKDVLDAGSGFGMVSILMAAWGARRVVALDVHEPMVRSHRRLLDTSFPRLEVHPLLGDVSRLPLPAASVDVILSIEAISHYHDAEAFLDECARVLRPRGALLVSDGNNGANPRIRAATEELWERLEHGPPGRCGDHEVEDPMVDRRARIIRAAFPQLGADRVTALAEVTSGYDRARIEEEIQAHLAGGPMPASPYRRGQCPREPTWGYWIERLFDPRELVSALARRGFAARALPHYGGARNDLIRAANAVLRTIPSFRFARAFRVVARKA
jgi:SAM-dependent methyltransferase